MTDVTIRGIEDETYSQFAAEAKKRGMSIGELTTMAMRAVIDQASAPVFRISDLDALSVSRSDFESIEGQVVFDDINMLEFDGTMDWPTFNKYVREINNVDLLIIHKGLSKFQVLTRGKNIDLIQVNK